MVGSYFYVLSEQYSPSTLWARYSMLRSVLKVKHNIDIDRYHTLKSFLKTNGFEPKKSKILKGEEIKNFLETAPDQTYLDVKVCKSILIFL